MEQEPESITILYALGIKGGYYNHAGDITQELSQAKLFSSEYEAEAFRRLHDPRHYIDCAMLLRLTVIIEQ
jgi:hypothetical protein